MNAEIRNNLGSVLLIGLTLGLAGCGPSPANAQLANSPTKEIGRFLKSESLPSGVSQAVAEITRLGREEGDFFGFQVVESYEIKKSAAKPELKKIVADVIEASRAHGDYSLAQFCREGFDQDGRQLRFDDDFECATYLIGHQRDARIDEVFGDLGHYYEGDNDSGRSLRKSLATLRKFIGAQVGGADREEISISMSGLNVSEETVVLINKTKGHVVILKYDYGA